MHYLSVIYMFIQLQVVIAVGAIPKNEKDPLWLVATNTSYSFQERMVSCSALDSTTDFQKAFYEMTRIAEGVPFGVHISYGSSDDEMVVSWAAHGPVRHDAIVFFSNTSDNIREQGVPIYALSDTYTASQQCGAVLGMDGYAYKASLTGLSPFTKYYYIAGFETINNFTAVFSFTTKPALNSDESNHVNFLLYGDMGGAWAGSGHKTTAALIQNQEVSKNAFTLLIGDLAYADGFDPYWDEWVVQIEPIAANHPFMVEIGNHENDYGECSIPTKVRFSSPNNNYDENSMYYYSFTYGPVKFIQMSTEHPYNRGSSQHSYLVRELSNVDRSVTPWLVFTGHRPMYDTQDSACSLLMRQELEAELVLHKVDVAFWGHMHDWQRHCAVINSVCVNISESGYFKDPQAPVHIVTGNTGRSFTYNYHIHQNSFNEIFIHELGYSKFYVNRTHFIGQMLMVSDGTVADEFMIEKTN